MKQQLKDKFQEWTREIDADKRLILTNDLDSLFTVAILKKLFNCQVGMFYDFESIYSTQKEKFNKDDIIGVDLAIEDNGIKTFCNHVTKMWKDDLVNPLSANLNNFANIHGGRYQTNYFSKYSGSTLLMVLSLYDAFDELLLDRHTELTEVQKMILVSIDSYFYGVDFMNGEHFYFWQHWMELELFDDIFDKYSKKDLIEFQKEHNLKGIIYEDNGQLQTTLDIAFLQEHFPMLDFSMDETFITCCPLNAKRSHYLSGTSKHDIEGNVFSIAVTSRDKVTYTLLGDD